MQRFKVSIKTESGVSQAMRKYCDECGISLWLFLQETISARLQKPYDFSIAEIEQKKKYGKGSDYEEFYFGISDEIAIEKLHTIREQYGISLNYFFVKTITEKLTELGRSFDDKTKPMRKIIEEKPRRNVSDINDLLISLQKIDMQKH